MNNLLYTIITFAPVQGFIENSRKLRDLYGSSFLLSYLSRVICDSAISYNCEVVSPAIINVTQGTPNQIIIKGNFPEEIAKESFDNAWSNIVDICRKYIERNLNGFVYTWSREWKAWKNHAWEFFWTQSEPGGSISDGRRNLNQIKYGRNWTGINWLGESSTLSGTGAIAYPRMTDKSHPLNSSIAEQSQKIADFYQQLSDIFGERIIDISERLSIPELIKRLITLPGVANQLTYLRETELPRVEIPPSFRDLSRQNDDSEDNQWTGWFQGDGDKIGEYLIRLRNTKSEDEGLNEFSQAMMNWGEEYLKKPFDAQYGRIIYAGGDDFLGVLYRSNSESDNKLSSLECLEWFYGFPEIWKQHQQGITVSVGFVWTAPGVPQRDILQHCREAEKAAKSLGRDRLAIRILFNSGTFLQWVCPWWCLQTFLKGYCDRSGEKSSNANWTHFYNDVAILESRHGFSGQQDVALELFSIYFGEENRQLLVKYLWDNEGKSGILGNQCSDDGDENIRALNGWVVDLAKVGFHLFRLNLG